jgi:hypothetical protein
MTTIGEQLAYPEGTPDDFQSDLERAEKRRKPRPLYPHTAVILADLGKQVTYTGPYTTMSRVAFLKTARDAATGKFDSANWSVSSRATPAR